MTRSLRYRKNFDFTLTHGSVAYKVTASAPSGPLGYSHWEVKTLDGAWIGSGGIPVGDSIKELKADLKAAAKRAVESHLKRSVK